MAMIGQLVEEGCLAVTDEQLATHYNSGRILQGRLVLDADPVERQYTFLHSLMHAGGVGSASSSFVFVEHS